MTPLSKDDLEESELRLLSQLWTQEDLLIQIWRSLQALQTDIEFLKNTEGHHNKNVPKTIADNEASKPLGVNLGR